MKNILAISLVVGYASAGGVQNGNGTIITVNMTRKQLKPDDLNENKFIRRRYTRLAEEFGMSLLQDGEIVNKNLFNSMNS